MKYRKLTPKETLQVARGKPAKCPMCETNTKTDAYIKQPTGVVLWACPSCFKEIDEIRDVHMERQEQRKANRQRVNEIRRKALNN